MMTPANDSRLRNATVLLAFLAVGVLMYFAKAALIPVAIALFLALLLTPAVDHMHRWRVPRGLAATLVLFAVLCAAGAAVDAVWEPAHEWLAHAPQTLRKIDERIRPLRKVVAQVGAVTERAGQLAQGGAPAGSPPEVSPAPQGGTALVVTKSAIEALTVLPLTLFFLIGGPPLLARLVASLSGKETTSDSLRLTDAIRLEVGHYFATIALINLCLGIVTAAAMWALGMPNPVLWGAIAGILNFVPYVGPFTTIAILAGAALVTFDDLPHALAVPGVFVLLHLLEGQIVQPLTVGRRLNVNALVVLLAVWFGFWFWGVAGVLLAVPMLVAVKVAAEHQPSWQVVRNFLAPNERWQPKSLDRIRRAGAGRLRRAPANPLADEIARVASKAE